MISSNPTAEEKVQYATWLTDAEAAHHRLMIGESEVSVAYNGESVTFRSSSMAQLRSYIAQLRKALGKSSVANPGVSFKPVTFGGR